MKEIFLLNPISPRRRKKGNPMKHRKRRRTTSRRRTTRRRTHRRNPVYFARRKHRRKGLKLLRSNPMRRRRHRRNPVHRRRHRRNPINLRGIGSTFKELVSKDTLTIAGGAVIGGLAASWIMSKWGPVKLVNGVPTAKTAADGFVLPGSSSQYGPLIYSVSIPLLGAAIVPFVLKNQAGKNLSRGMLIGSAVLLIQNVVNVIQGSMSKPVAGTGAYVTGGGIRTLGAPQSAIPAVRGTGANPLRQGTPFRGF